MLMRLLTLLWAFVFSAVLSSGITLFPMTVVWSSIWVYITFIICLIPGFFFAWLTVIGGVALIGVLGFGTIMAGAGIFDILEKSKRRKRM